MIESLQLGGLSERTQDAYVRTVRQLADHFHQPPDLISEEEIRQYFLFLKNVKHSSRSAMALALHGIKFFYRQIVSRVIPVLDFIRPPREKKLPVVRHGKGAKALSHTSCGNRLTFVQRLKPQPRRPP